MNKEDITVMVADASHEKYVDTILDTIEKAAKVRGTGIAKRTHEYVATKMKEAKAVIALYGEEFVGFSSSAQSAGESVKALTAEIPTTKRENLPKSHRRPRHSRTSSYR